MSNKDAKSPWGSAVSIEKRELFEERAETILLIIKQRFPGISQSGLDISKIQFNKVILPALVLLIINCHNLNDNMMGLYKCYCYDIAGCWARAT